MELRILMDLTTVLLIIVAVMVLFAVGHFIGFHRGLKSAFKYIAYQDIYEDEERLYREWSEWVRSK